MTLCGEVPGRHATNVHKYWTFQDEINAFYIMFPHDDATYAGPRFLAVRDSPLVLFSLVSSEL